MQGGVDPVGSMRQFMLTPPPMDGLEFTDSIGSGITETSSHSNEFLVNTGPETGDLPELRWVLSGSDSAATFLAAQILLHDANWVCVSCYLTCLCYRENLPRGVELSPILGRTRMTKG